MKHTGIYVSAFLLGLAIGYMEEDMIHSVVTKSNHATKKMKREVSHVLDDMRDMMD